MCKKERERERERERENTYCINTNKILGSHIRMKCQRSEKIHKYLCVCVCEREGERNSVGVWHGRKFLLKWRMKTVCVKKGVINNIQHILIVFRPRPTTAINYQSKISTTFDPSPMLKLVKSQRSLDVN